MKRAVITGATSMIGQAILEECLNRGVEVCAVIRQDTVRKDRLPSHPLLTVAECDLDHLEELSGIVKGTWDVFYHIAWAYTGAQRNKSQELQNKNIDYTLHAVKAAAGLGCKRFIGAGSQAEYGPLNQEKIGPDAPLHPITPYGISKAEAGRQSKALCHQLGIQWIWPRIFSVYGVYDKESTMVMTAIRQFLQEEETSFTPAEQQWDYLYSKDAGKALYLIGEKGKADQVYCIGSGVAMPLKDYIFRIRDVAAPGAVPGIGKKPYPPHPVMRLCADIENLTRDTGFVPEYSFERGIREVTAALEETLREGEHT